MWSMWNINSVWIYRIIRYHYNAHCKRHQETQSLLSVISVECLKLVTQAVHVRHEDMMEWDKNFLDHVWVQLLENICYDSKESNLQVWKQCIHILIFVMQHKYLPSIQILYYQYSLSPPFSPLFSLSLTLPLSAFSVSLLVKLLRGLTLHFIIQFLDLVRMLFMACRKKYPKRLCLYA